MYEPHRIIRCGFFFFLHNKNAVFCVSPWTRAAGTRILQLPNESHGANDHDNIT